MSKFGIFLCNLGSPDAPTTEALRPYLREFLSDDRVIDAPKVVQQALLNLVILPFRPKKSAEAYEKVWTDEGSPLIVSTYEIQEKLQARVGEEIPIAVGMRYGNPSTETAIKELMAQGVEHVFLVPLYPHYAMSSYETAVVKVKEVIADVAPHMELSIQPPFWDDEDYIDALIDVASPHLEDDFDMLLFSYHGVPERHVRKGDPSGCYCLTPGCCDKVTPVQSMCYRAQCIGTSRLFARRAGIPDDKWMVSFQSRLGPDPWLKPATDDTLEHFPERGVKRVVVMCPAFISDCLETLEEINMEGREEFMEAGGEEFRYVPCLNSEDVWIEVLERFYRDFEAGALDRTIAPTELAEAPAAAGE